MSKHGTTELTEEEMVEIQKGMAATMFDQMSEGMKRFGATDDEVVEARALADQMEANEPGTGEDVFAAWLLKRMGR